MRAFKLVSEAIPLLSLTLLTACGLGSTLPTDSQQVGSELEIRQEGNDLQPGRDSKFIASGRAFREIAEMEMQEFNATRGIYIPHFDWRQQQRECTKYVVRGVHEKQIWGTNTIMYHNTNSKFSFAHFEHAHQDLNLEYHTVGYELLALDHGTFDRYGDGGYENWAFIGWWHREERDTHVEFYTPPGGPVIGIFNGQEVTILNTTITPRLGGAVEPEDIEHEKAFNAELAVAWKKMLA